MTSKGKDEGDAVSEQQWSEIKDSASLKEFLEEVKGKLVKETCAPIYALAALNGVMTMPNIDELLDPSTKEVAFDIWERLKKAGVQLKEPPLLYS